MRKATLFTFIVKIFTITLLVNPLWAHESLGVITYNLGLAHTFVPLATERLPHLIEKISQVNADVVCMQEVWTEADRNSVVNGVSALFPYSYMIPIKQKISQQRPTCHLNDLFGKEKFVTCLQTKCKGISGDEFTTCIIEKCRGSLDKLKNDNPECAQGMIAQVGKSTFSALYAVLNPFKGAGLFSYKGSDGLILLSKKELYNQRTLDFSDISTGTRRRALLAEVRNGQQEVTISCTHLTANLASTVPYTGDFADWKMENMAQAQRLIKETENIQNPLLLAGDYNCSIENQDLGIKAEFSKSCELFLDNGYLDHFYKENGQCTFCEDNTLVKKSENGAEDFLLDHIFTKNLNVAGSHLVFDELVTIERKKKEPVESNLSDHYGIFMEFEL